MALSIPYTMSAVTVGSTELSIVSGTTTLQSITTDGYYTIVIDPVTNMAKGDAFIVRVKDKAISGGTQRTLADQTISQAQSQIWVSPPFRLTYGWDVTIQKVSGTDRAFDASIRAAT